MSKRQELKQFLKQTAVTIRTTKHCIKEYQRNHNGWHPYRNECGDTSMWRLKHEYRHHHIAYSMLRGKTYEQVENKCADDNTPDMNYVERIMLKYEDVCVSAE